MKKTVGMVLIVVGAAVMIAGIYVALSAFSGLYTGNLTDPLNQPENAEENVKSDMFRGAMIGAAGAPLFITGRIMLRSARRRAARR